jgi:hypothetical protein
VVLGIALVFEGYSFFIAFKAFQSEKGDQTIWQSINNSKPLSMWPRERLQRDRSHPLGGGYPRKSALF